MSSENPRYRGLRPNPASLGVVALEEGEETRTMRIRAATDVIAWAAALSAADRGLILAQAFTRQQTSGRPAPRVTAQTPGQASAGPSRAAGERVGAPSPTRSTAQPEALTLGTLPTDLRPHHRPIIQALQAGATLTRAPGGVWRLEGAGQPPRTIKPTTVELLEREGVLTRERV